MPGRSAFWIALHWQVHVYVAALALHWQVHVYVAALALHWQVCCSSNILLGL